MATEIELKAHVRDSEVLRALLCEKAEYSNAFEKEDQYWSNEATFPAQSKPISRLRIRREKHSFPDGREESGCVASYKNKLVRDGIEVNDEREFQVNPVSDFEDFLLKMGFKPGDSKRKRGWAFSYGEINAELVEVEGLGWFVELEILINDIQADGMAASGKHEKIFKDSRKKLLDFLDKLGIKRKAIESRFYSDMLKEVK